MALITMDTSHCLSDAIYVEENDLILKQVD